jgi:predicted RNA methylase
VHDDPGAWGAAYSRALHDADPARASALGAWGTPAPVATRLADATLAHASQDATVLDPFCGGGALLVAAARWLWAQRGDATSDARLATARRQLRGWEIDPAAAAVARAALQAAAGAPPGALDDLIEVRDALAPDAHAAVDVVLTNPPWVGADAMAHDPARRRDLARRFRSARGNWDLFVPSLDAALGWLKPSGVLGLLAPDKLAAAPYADRLRARLHGEGRVVWAERFPRGAFDAQVDTLALVRLPGAVGEVPPGAPRWPSDGAAWPLHPDDAARLHAYAGHPTLGAVADVCAAATVAEAYAWTTAIASGAPDATHLACVNTGTIDPLRSLWSERPLRYLGRQVPSPVIDLTALSPRRAAQARRPKLIVAGLSKRLEVLIDREGTLVGLKSTVLVLPHDPADLQRLAAWLDSDEASALYRAQHGGLGFQGGHLRVGARELRSLPVPSRTP